MFKLRMIKATTVNSRRLVAGCEIEVDTNTALSMIRSGVARLADENDMVRLLDAMRPVTTWCPRALQTR